MKAVLLHILSLMKTVWINIRFLPFKQALRLPICVSYDTEFKVFSGGGIFIEHAIPCIIRIGFHQVPACNRQKTKIDIHGQLIFRGEAHIGNGSKIYVSNNASLIIGDDFKISANSSILCYHKIEFG